MRVVIQGKELEFRVQERKVTTCSVFHKGKEIAADLAIHAPQDPYDQREGERIAVERTAEILFKRQLLERKESMEKVDKVFTEVGALSGNVELPALEPAVSIVQKVMAKLDARREKAKATLTIDKPKETMKTLSKPSPSPFGNLPFSSVPILFSPFLGRPSFGILPNGNQWKP